VRHTPAHDPRGHPGSGADSANDSSGVFLIGAAFAMVGGLISWLLIPDRERDLESEDARFRAYLESAGYSGAFGESLEKEIKTTAFKL